MSTGLILKLSIFGHSCLALRSLGTFTSFPYITLFSLLQYSQTKSNQVKLIKGALEAHFALFWGFFLILLDTGCGGKLLYYSQKLVDPKM